MSDVTTDKPDQATGQDVSEKAQEAARITPRAVILGTVVTVVFAFLTAYMENRKQQYLTSDQIAVMPYVLVFLTVMLINPILGAISWGVKRIKFLSRLLRPMSLAEILVIFIMGAVSSGLSTFGLVSQLLPLSGSFYNEHWNNEQSQWNLHIAPFLNDAFFVSEPGISEAAADYRSEYLALEALNEPYRLASRLTRQREQVAEEAANVEALAAEVGDDASPEQADALAAARKSQSRRETALAELEAEWETARAAYDAPPVEETLSSYPAKIASKRAEMEAAKAELAVLEEKAFAKVERFRRGLPDEMRAFPGSIKIAGEDWATYSGRVRRFWMGVEARNEIEAALDQAKSGGSLDQARIDAAIAKLKDVSDAAALQARVDELDAEWNSVNDLSQEKAQARRQAVINSEMATSSSEIKDLNSQAHTLGKEIQALNRDKRDLTQRKGMVLAQLRSVERVQAMIADLEALPGKGLSGQELATELAALHDRFSTFDASWRRFLIGEVPYSVWLRPLMGWGLLIGLTYIALMAFNVLIYRQWAYNERLIYPLAKLPEMMAGTNADGSADTSGNWLPKLYRNGYFWGGFAIAAFVMGWNVFVKANVVQDLPQLPLKFLLDPYLGGSSFSGLGAKLVAFHIMFVMIGLAFLIPANISFSLWFFHVLMFCQTLLLVWLGLGNNIRDFPSEWYYTLNFRTAEGGGALLVFSTVTLWKCRTYLFSCFMPQAVAHLETDERKELRIASAAFIVSGIGIVLVLTFGMGANLFWTLFSLFIILTITVGLVRAVTEGGILGFQAWVSPFHFMRSGVGMDKPWSGAPHILAIFVYYGVLFLDIKTFVAPAMANAIKIRDDLKMRRLRFHVAIAFCIVFAAVTAITLHLMLSYDKGADQMNGWFYSGMPKDMYMKAAAMVKEGPVDPTGSSGYWILFGAIAMAVLIWGRQHLFWLPHPIGFIMLVNPRMNVYWFSILIGWFCKRLVTKYGNKDTYDRLRGFFVGLIVGELVIIFVSTALSIILEKNIGVNLNRY